jgi:hypothetical protein
MNSLTELPPEVCRLPELRRLSLIGNKLTKLPSEIGSLSNLRELYLDRNQLTALPREIGQLTRLRELHLDNNHLTTLPPEIGELSALILLDVESNLLTSLPRELGRLTGLRAIYAAANPLPEPYPELIDRDDAKGTAQRLLPWLRGDHAEPTRADDATADIPPPPLPAQGAGPHFEVDESGVITLAPPEALDRNGNHVGRLQALQPTLRDLSQELFERLSGGNAPYMLLADRVGAYSEIIDGDLSEVNFSLLYIEGIRLANAEVAASKDRELPPLDPLTREQLATLLQLHGTFILSTAEGAACIEAEQRYQRRPAEEAQYRIAAVEVASSLQNRPDVIDSSAASAVLRAAEEIGQGSHPERSSTAGTGALRNAVITFAASATIAALPVAGSLTLGPGGLVAGAMAALLAGESLKRSKPFTTIISAISRTIDGIATADEERFSKLKRKFDKHLSLVQNLDAKLRQLATENEAQFSWLNAALDWLKGRTNEEGDTQDC